MAKILDATPGVSFTTEAEIETLLIDSYPSSAQNGIYRLTVGCDAKLHPSYTGIDGSFTASTAVIHS